MAWFKCLCLVLGLFVFYLSDAVPQQGRWHFKLSEDNQIVVVTKSTYNNTKLFLKLDCQAGENQGDVYLIVSFVVRKIICASNILGTNETLISYHHYPEHPILDFQESEVAYVYKSEPETVRCNKAIIISRHDNEDLNAFSITGNNTIENQLIEQKPKFNNPVIIKREVNSSNLLKGNETKNQQLDKAIYSPKYLIVKDPHPQFILKRDGIYLITVAVEPNATNTKYDANLEMEIFSNYGYLSAEDWPLLPFYGIMCVIYLIFGIGWTIVSLMHWKDILQIQYWIGGVILLGMLESAVFYAEFHSINSTGRSMKGAIVFAEIVSVIKRSLARMLVIIVSFGFGIVKPRLGPLFHKLVCIGFLFFVLSCVDGYFRVIETEHSGIQPVILGQLPLALLDAAICWVIFSNLIQTMRTLRLRRNIVKLQLYRNFTSTLAFAVIASIPFMIWTIRAYKMSECIYDWKELWTEQAYWPLLFSVILLVIMILWRPSINNQRYAFSPLLDTSDDEEEEDEMFSSEAFEGMKSRSQRSQRESIYLECNDMSNIEADLKWVDEHIPSTMADIALPPLLDSDEEEMNTEFEISKMQ